MVISNHDVEDAFDPRFKIFHDLMAKKIREILLVSSPYDAWIMAEDCRLSERIVSEYRGLNLSNPPRLTWVSSAGDALAALDRKKFDMVIAMPSMADMDAAAMGRAIKRAAPRLPVILFSHQAGADPVCDPASDGPRGIDRTFIWSGNTDILLAVVKSAEDRMNVDHDTASAGIRVIIFVEDSPAYISSLLPFFYRELVTQTQAVMVEGLNEEHRLLAMRARPKILVAETFEQAVALYQSHEPYVLGVISDMRFPRNRSLDDQAGVALLTKIKRERFDIPLLLTSSEPASAEKASEIPAQFVDKNSPSLHTDVRSFFLDHLGFGDFVFRRPDGLEIGRASTLRALEDGIKAIPDDSFVFHCRRNDFSRWLFARTEIELASRVRPLREDDFASVRNHRDYLISIVHARRRRRQRGVVVNFDAAEFDPETEFLRIGAGSLGGKARGLAFTSAYLNRNRHIHEKFDTVDILVPRTLVITTETFDAFIEKNGLKPLSRGDMPDKRIAQAFLDAEFPGVFEKDLDAFLSRVKGPLAVRSSSLLEDAQFRAYAGLYKTYMLPNDDPDRTCRLAQLVSAVKLVYASTYFRDPRAFSKRVGHRTEEEKMAVIVQGVIGKNIDGYFYPAISGVAQSRNYYPFSAMKPEDGIATIALGLGKIVVEGEKTLRFSPRHPQLLPNFSTVDDILQNAQRVFYALRMGAGCYELGTDEGITLEKRDIHEAANEAPVKLLSGTYIPDEHRIRDTWQTNGFQVLTFARVLKYDLIPLPAILADVLDLGEKGMGCPVEIEFSVNLDTAGRDRAQFAVLQVRPMTAREELMRVTIHAEEKEKAFCVSTRALGNAEKRDMADIIFVRPDGFDPGHTVDIAREIGRINNTLVDQNRRYVLIGPGRWGSADRWLGIPVTWSDISGVGAIAETDHPKLRAEPSQGSHFFHNITTLGINYITVSDGGKAFLDWAWLLSLPPETSTAFVTHVRLERPITLKVDGRTSEGVMIY